MKKDIKPKNDKDQPHGYWELYYDNGKLHYKCLYINGKENGFEEWYSYSSRYTNIKNYYL